VILRQLPGDDITAPVIAILKDKDDSVRLEALMILRGLEQGGRTAPRSPLLPPRWRLSPTQAFESRRGNH
jgi:hypothetical protein